MLNDASTLARPFQARKYTGQEVVGVREGNLIWRETHTPILDYLYERIDNTEDILLKFIRLHSGSSDEILTFARKWGVLGICEHSFPASHNPPRMSKSKDHPACKALRLNDGNYREPLERWRYYSRQARAILRIAARLHQGKIGLQEDWDAVYYPETADPRAISDTDPGWDKLTLTLLVNDWLELGDVHPRFRWIENEVGASYYCALFGLLATQLMLVISRSKGVGICSSCGEPYIPKRRLPKSNQRNYCHRPKCGRSAALRDAQRERRRKKENA